MPKKEKQKKPLLEEIRFYSTRPNFTKRIIMDMSSVQEKGESAIIEAAINSAYLPGDSTILSLMEKHLYSDEKNGIKMTLSSYIDNLIQTGEILNPMGIYHIANYLLTQTTIKDSAETSDELDKAIEVYLSSINDVQKGKISIIEKYSKPNFIESAKEQFIRACNLLMATIFSGQEKLAYNIIALLTNSDINWGNTPEERVTFIRCMIMLAAEGKRPFSFHTK